MSTIGQLVYSASRTDCLCEPPYRPVPVCCLAKLNAAPREEVVDLTRNAQVRLTGTAATRVMAKAVVVAQAAEKIPTVGRAKFASAPIRLESAWSLPAQRRAASPLRSARLTTTAAYIVLSHALKKLCPRRATIETARTYTQTITVDVSYLKSERLIETQARRLDRL